MPKMFVLDIHLLNRAKHIKQLIFTLFYIKFGLMEVKVTPFHSA